MHITSTALAHLIPVLLELALHGTRADAMLNVFALSILTTIVMRMAHVSLKQGIRDLIICYSLAWMTVLLWITCTFFLKLRGLA